MGGGFVAAAGEVEKRHPMRVKNAERAVQSLGADIDATAPRGGADKEHGLAKDEFRQFLSHAFVMLCHVRAVLKPEESAGKSG